jgi:voltage-gated potassium channel
VSSPLGSWARPVWSALGLLVAYYAFPVGWSDTLAWVVVSLLLTAGGLALLGLTMVKEVGSLRRGDAHLSTQTLSMLLVLLVISFSLAFFLLNLVNPGQIVNLSTRTDALYFTLSTMATVGYGDVHAEGQVARALVCGLIAFNVVVVAALLRVHTARRASEVLGENN